MSTFVKSLAIAFLLLSVSESVADELLVKTSSGYLRGVFSNLDPSIRTWLGIPYAQPPVGSLRWYIETGFSPPLCSYHYKENVRWQTH
jgi:carboxylesterase type B